MTILEIKNLSVNFKTPQGEITAVQNADLNLTAGKITALVGESGSGKSVLSLSILKLLPSQIAFHKTGEIIFNGQNLLTSSANDMQKISGNKISMIFQEPMTALNPLHTIRKQLSEILTIHQNLSAKLINQRIIETLNLVGLSNLSDRLDSYPHNLSGGQRQRLLIAMAIINEPQILIADEPTTALDIATQKQILSLIKELQLKNNMAVLLISHNLNIVKNIADNVCVMQKGKIIEQGSTHDIFNNSKEAYTKLLIGAKPQGSAVKIDKDSSNILTVKNLNVTFVIKKSFFGKEVQSLQALQDINFSLNSGETLGVVGESGSGKTTLATAILRLIKANGQIDFLGTRLDQIKGETLRKIRKNLQIVFQDPFASLNPRLSIAEIISEGIKAHNLINDQNLITKKITSILNEVGLEADCMNRYPHEFSGGQRQRIAIARAVILEPKLIIFDEPTSALDATIQLQVLEMLKTLQQRYKIAFIIISHDLEVIKAISHKIIILKNGQIIEQGSTEEIFLNPYQEYTKEMIEFQFS